MTPHEFVAKWRTVNLTERSAAQQAVAVNETTTTMEELGASSRLSAEQAEAASNGTRQALSLADVAADRLSCHAYRANALRLQIHALAYNLLTLFRRVALGATALAKATLGTIRLKLFKVGARVQRSVRRLWYHLPTGWPGQDVYLATVDQLLAIGKVVVERTDGDARRLRDHFHLGAGRAVLGERALGTGQDRVARLGAKPLAQPTSRREARALHRSGRARP